MIRTALSTMSFSVSDESPRVVGDRPECRQPNNRRPLIVSVTAAVASWTQAVALVQPCLRTIAALASGMIVAASMNQPSK